MKISCENYLPAETFASPFAGRATDRRLKRTEGDRRAYTSSVSVVWFLLLLILCANAACKQTAVDANSNAANDNSSALEVSSTPPFSTREPERYRATRITMTSSGNGTTEAGASHSSRSEVFIARDGERRREDYETNPGGKWSRLELPGRVYLIYHAKKLYAEIKPDKRVREGAARSDISELPDFSPDKLINESRAESRYEKLGAEEINGRAATKYRVTTSVSGSGAQQTLTTETILWIDEALGMTIRSETTSTGGGANAAKYAVELQDIGQDVDAAWFALPEGYKQVEYKELAAQLLEETHNSSLK